MAAYEVVVADIEASADGMTSAGASVAAVDPTADLGSVATALTGGASAAAATSLTEVWSQRFTTWSTDAKKHGEARHTSATNYSRADHEAARQLQQDAMINRGPGMHRDE